MNDGKTIALPEELNSLHSISLFTNKLNSPPTYFSSEQFFNNLENNNLDTQSNNFSNKLL